MGGFGSGSWQSQRLRCESACAIDVRRWRREGYLNEGRQFGWQWTRNGEKTASIGVHVEHEWGLRLVYAVDGTPVDEVVPLGRTPCHYGGSRTWFHCPRCHHRAAKLYCVGGRFRCRRCQGLRYVSQLETGGQRFVMAQVRIGKKLAGHEWTVPDLPAKPPRMWWRTYDRLTARWERLEQRANAQLVYAVERLMARA